MSLNWAIMPQKQPKTLYCVKVESTVNYSTVTKYFKRFCLGGKNLDDQARSCRPKIVDSEVMLQAIEANPASSTQRVSGKLSISQSGMVQHFHNICKSSWHCSIVLHIIKMSKNF